MRGTVLASAAVHPRRRSLSAAVGAAAVIGCLLAAVGIGSHVISGGGGSKPRPAFPPPGGSDSGFVRVCGTSFCIRNSRFWIKGATAYGQYDAPSALVASASDGNLNTLELVEFDIAHHELSDTRSPATWARIDKVIAAARAQHLHVILNLSEFGQSLQEAGSTMSSSSWQPQWNDYLSFVANRVNTATGVVYKSDPTIAMVEIWGEIPAPGYSGAVGSSDQLQAFYAATLAAWKKLAPNILISSGGFSYLNDPQSHIPWRAIMSDPNNAACSFEINSASDRNTTARMVTQYCRALGKPWFLAAWSSCNKATGQDLHDWFDGGPITDAKMAAHAKDMYGIAQGGSPATYRSLGTDFWNLGPDATESCELGPQFPETWDVIQSS